MTFMETYLQVGGALWVSVTCIWLVSLVKKNAAIIDPCWSLFFLLATTLAWLSGPGGTRATLLLVMVALWALRLSIYLFARAWGEPEDPRYRKWREKNGKIWWWRSYFTVFILQGLLAWIICIPLVLGTRSDAPLHWLDAVGVALWAFGLFYEAVGDWQLARFKANPANTGKLLDSGLWRTTRHPNYFGEAVLWWGFFVIALTSGGAWSVYAPMLMTLLLMRVSGVTLLERRLVKVKPGYAQYMETTPAFFPNFFGKK